MIKRLDAASIFVQHNPLRFGNRSASGETEFHEVILPDRERYEQLIEGIGKQKGSLDAGKDRLQATEEALSAVIRFLQYDRAVVFYDLAAPLVLLQAAIHDIRHGAKPKLFKSSEGSAPNHPAGDVFNAIRGQITAAHAALVTAGFTIKDAAIEVEKRLKDLQITQPNGAPIRAKLIERWREDINQKKADRLMTLTFQHIKQQGEEEPARLASKQGALNWCEALLKSVTVWTPPQNPHMRRR